MLQCLCVTYCFFVFQFFYRYMFLDFLVLFFFFFFFKQKTAYEMQRGLVGSEMCIRDRYQRRVHGILNIMTMEVLNDEKNFNNVISFRTFDHIINCVYKQKKYSFQ
eukprot:TRINITY_DN5190_c0_g1_i15.p2 TRINITY_DN5190_c0_g1~~TRINITY_DN5190_c0_g1_i15.p2  ORF type:complete len:106 (-),score=37.43 TRINITY_DN5190_c0_g1_i15:431-748(-)